MITDKVLQMKMNEALATAEYTDLQQAFVDRGRTLALLCVCGSYAYGTNTAQSDVDIRGIFVPSFADLVGIKKHKETYRLRCTDTVLFSLQKTVSLALKCNPMILEMLAVNDEFVISDSLVADELRRLRPLLLTKTRVFTAYGGFVHQLMKKVQCHRDMSIRYKSATHVVRLCLTAIEWFRTGEFVVYRQGDEHEFLVNIRNGGIDITKAYKICTELCKQFKQAYEQSTMCDDVNDDVVNDRIVHIMREMLHI